MNDQEKRTLDMFRCVRDFNATREGLFPPGTLAHERFEAMAAIVSKLEGDATAESAARGTARQGTAGKSVARAAILEALGILRRTARSMSGSMPGLEDKFRLPHKGDDQELLTTARAALAEAEPLKAEFLRREVPESVFQDLADHITAFGAALTGQYAGKEASTTAAAAIDAAINRGLEILRELDPIVRNKLHHDDPALAAWRKARRIERAPRRNSHKQSPEPKKPQS
jgi:hypothetical protein